MSYDFISILTQITLLVHLHIAIKHINQSINHFYSTFLKANYKSWQLLLSLLAETANKNENQDRLKDRR